MLSGDRDEVGHVLGQHGPLVGDSVGEDLGVGGAGHTEFDDRDRVDPGCPQRCGERGRIHLVEQQFQAWLAAVVWLRCSSIRAWTSSG